jgi:CubicO group peptidase (beta-lactamase class C family)
MMKPSSFLGSLLLLFAISEGFSQSPDIYVHQFMKEGSVPGVFVAVVKRDSILFEKGFGFANVNKRLQVTRQTCMELGSISKAFTDETILYLNRRGLLQLDDPITKYFPDAPPSWSSITIEHLMEHSSGIQNYLLSAQFKASNIFNYSPADTQALFFLDKISTDSMIRLFYSLPLEFKPGETWSYSNTGYYLLGKIVERATRKPFFELVKEVFTGPLKMTQSKANELAADNGCLSPGYFYTPEGLKTAPILTSRYAFAAGAWSTSGNDMIEYMKAVHLHRLPSDKVGSNWRDLPPTYELPFTYHCGRFYSIYHGKHLYLHDGGTPGFSSSWIYLREEGISIIVLANRQDYAPIDRLAWNILSLYTPSLKYKNDSLHGNLDQKYSRVLMSIVQAIQNNKELPEGLSHPFHLFLNSENGRGLWKWVFEKGYPTACACNDEERLRGANAYRFTLTAHAGLVYRVTVIVNSHGEVTQLLWW